MIYHVPTVVPGYDSDGRSCWRVICDGCSQKAQDYVERCRLQPERQDWPAICLYEQAPQEKS